MSDATLLFWSIDQIKTCCLVDREANNVLILRLRLVEEPLCLRDLHHPSVTVSSGSEPRPTIFKFLKRQKDPPERVKDPCV